MYLKIFFYLSILIFSIPNHSNEIEYEFPALTKFLEKEVKKGNTQKNIKDYFSQKNEENDKNLNQKK